MSEHFEMVRVRYREKRNGSESIPEASIEQNELTRGLRG